MNDNKRKLIGTIIGVIFFIILIAGATFALLTYTADVNNGIYNIGTTHFLVDYIGASDITDLTIFDSSIMTDRYAGMNNLKRYVTASKVDIDGTLYIKLHVNDDNDSNLLVANAGTIRYAVYVSGDCNNLDILSDCASSYGLINSLDSNHDAIIFTGPLQSSPTNYTIILWLDNAMITNGLMGLNFTGYIYAFAIQSEVPVPSSSSDDR